MSPAHRYFLPTVALLLIHCIGFAQQKEKTGRCATVAVLQNALERNPALKTNFERSLQDVRQATVLRKQSTLRENGEPMYVPVVFHIVLQNPNLVTDAQVLAQLDSLNKDFAGINADSTKIPAAFKALFGKGRIQFKLAQRTPNDEPSTGINRYVTTRSSYAYTDNSLKYTAQGGADAWDPSRYLNIWLTNISGGILGYATFPGGSVTAEQGVVVLYRSLPGGTAAPYNKGRTLTHETGHFFFLYHIWGDDDGACTGTDYIDETPNQADETGGCPSGVRTDDCTPQAPGIMYQNFMDYTDDACMVMFTDEQDVRMETAFTMYRASLLTSNGADPVVLKNINASLRSINTPSRICNASFSPSITLRNLGAQVLTSASVYVSVDGGAPVRTQWTGSLASSSAIDITLSPLTVNAGRHNLKIYVADPNGTIDDELTDDTLTSSIEYYPPAEPPLAEGFEGNTFPPQGWDIVNPDGFFTWERVTGVAKTGNASVVMRNLQYEQNGPKDYLRLPQININSADSAFLSFQVAAAVQTDPSTPNNVWDTLQVLVSADCGNTYTSLYKKWGSSLVTRRTAVTASFVPLSAEWRKDSVDLTAYIGRGPIVLAFLNSSEFENNIYLDDINVNKVVINPNLKEKGILVSPNPTTGVLSVQFYPNPTNLKGIGIYDVAGQRIVERMIGNNGSTRYDFDLSPYANGLYTVRIVFSDRTVVHKVIKNR